MCTQKTEVHGGFYITIRSVHWLREKENVYLQIQDSYWNNLRSKAYEYLIFSPIKYTEHRTTRKMTLVNLVLESLADGISAERAIFMSASPKLLWKRNSGNDIRGFFTASEPNKTSIRVQVECSGHAETANHADRETLQ